MLQYVPEGSFTTGPADTIGVQLTGVWETAVASGVEAPAGVVKPKETREAKVTVATPEIRAVILGLRNKKLPPE